MCVAQSGGARCEAVAADSIACTTRGVMSRLALPTLPTGPNNLKNWAGSRLAVIVLT